MRNVLIDYAKKAKAAKRGRDFERVSIESKPVADTTALDLDELIAVANAMDKLQDVDDVAHRVAMLRHYLGMSEKEVAQELELGERTVRRRWQYGRAFLHRELRQGGGSQAAAPG